MSIKFFSAISMDASTDAVVHNLALLDEFLGGDLEG